MGARTKTENARYDIAGSNPIVVSSWRTRLPTTWRCMSVCTPQNESAMFAFGGNAYGLWNLHRQRPLYARIMDACVPFV
jgi:hypothetical protein